MRHFVFAFAILLIVDGAVYANHTAQFDGPVRFSFPDGPAPPNHPELMILTFNISTSSGKITGLTIDLTGSVRQSGTVGMPFTDFGNLDSHFLFSPLGDHLTIASATEDTTHIRGSFTGFDAFASRDVLQLVIGQRTLIERAHYDAQATVELPGGTIQVFRGSDDIIPNFVPEPSTIMLVVVVIPVMFIFVLHWRARNRIKTNHTRLIA